MTPSKKTKTKTVDRSVAKPHVLKGDTVMVRRGKDKARRGVVKAVFPRDGMAIVEGLNLAKRHTKPGQAGQVGGIVEQEVPLPICALMVIDPKTDAPTRIRRVRSGDRTERVAVRGGAVIPAPGKG